MISDKNQKVVSVAAKLTLSELSDENDDDGLKLISLP
jgi:hypothetical protein